jgi:hypothetical protein
MDVSKFNCTFVCLVGLSGGRPGLSGGCPAPFLVMSRSVSGGCPAPFLVDVHLCFWWMSISLSGGSPSQCMVDVHICV